MDHPRLRGEHARAGPRVQRLEMANGQKLNVAVLSRSSRFPIIVLADKDGRWFNDRVVKSKIDVVETENTVVHGISGVLLPNL